MNPFDSIGAAADRLTSFLDPIVAALATVVLTILIFASKLLAIVICLLLIIVPASIFIVTIARMLGYGHANSGRRSDGDSGP